MRSLIICAFYVFLSSCAEKINERSDIVVRDAVYLDKNGSKVSGWVVDRYPNGKIAFKAKLKNGEPEGVWLQLGYKGEIIQQGNYKSFEPELYRAKIKRIQQVTFKEGQYNAVFYQAILTDSLMTEEKDSVAHWLEKKFNINRKMIKFENQEF